MNNEIKSLKVIYIGIGAFLLWSIQAYAYSFEKIIFELLISNGMEHYISLFVPPLLYFILFILFIILGINLILKSNKADLTILKISIVILVIGLVFQYLIAELADSLKSEHYLDNYSKYKEYLLENPLNMSIYLIKSVTYIIFGIIIYKKYNAIQSSISK